MGFQPGVLGPEQRVHRPQRRYRFLGNPVFPKSADAFFTGVQHLMDHASGLPVQRQAPFAHSRKQRLEPGGQPLHRLQIHRPSCPFQAVRAAERLIDLAPPLRFGDIFKQREDGADLFQVLGMLALKYGGKSLMNPGQIRYPSVAVRSCMPRSVRLAAALSVCRVLVAACSLARLRSFMAWVTFSNPICCWFVPATIC